MVFSPLGRQFLTGQSTDCSQLDDSNMRSTIARPRFEPDNFKENSKLLIPFAELVKQQGMTMAQLSLAWLLAQGEDIIPISGISNLHHLKENAAVGDLKLSNETIIKLDSMINEDLVVGERYNDFLMSTVDSERD